MEISHATGGSKQSGLDNLFNEMSGITVALIITTKDTHGFARFPSKSF
jgi:hypothetical protein